MYNKYQTLAKTICFMVIAIAVGAIYNIVLTQHVSAYTATITTAGIINLEVSPAGDSANTATDNVIINSTCPQGYTLSISGPADSALYRDGDNTSIYKIAASSGVATSPASITGTNLGTWGYTTDGNVLSDVNSASFVGLSDTITEVVSKSSASGDGTTATDTVSIYYGASVAPSTASGIYKLAESSTGVGDNMITYYLTTSPSCDATPYTINFDSNMGSGTMSPQSANSGEAVPLDANSFTAPAGRKFIGWNTKADGSGTNYTDGQSVTDLATANESIILYAQWEKNPVSGYIAYDDNHRTATYDMSNQQATGEYIRLWPANYAKDGYGFAGWSTEKLNPYADDFDAKLKAAVSAGKVYGPNEDVDPAAVSGRVLYAVWVASQGAMQDWSDCSILSVGDVIALTDTRDNNTYAIAKLVDGNCWMIENSRLVSAAYNTENITSTVADMTDPGNNVYQYGNYYQFDLANSSVCPAGWRLPTGSRGEEVSALDVALGGTGLAQNGDVGITNRWRKFPINYNLGGYIYGDTYVTRRGARSGVWTSTEYSATQAYHTTFNESSNLYRPGVAWNEKTYGFFVRCLSSNTERNPVKNYILYDGNGNTSAHTNGSQNIAEDTTITPRPNNFARTGYGFVGWSTEKLDPDASNFATLLNNAVSAGKVYGPNETITNTTFINQAKNNGIILYAVWAKSAGTFQSWTSCSSLAQGRVTALTDTRDNNTYAIAKLADGKCWMIENLRYSNGAVNTDNVTNPRAVLIGAASNTFSYGSYYEWSGASSACPTRWRLPTGGPDNEFSKLDIALGGNGTDTQGGTENFSNRFRKYPVNYVYSGHYNVSDSTIYQRGERSRFYSSTAESSSSMHGLYLSDTRVYPLDSLGKTSQGYSVRCVYN